MNDFGVYMLIIIAQSDVKLNIMTELRKTLKTTKVFATPFWPHYLSLIANLHEFFEVETHDPSRRRTVQRYEWSQ